MPKATTSHVLSVIALVAAGELLAGSLGCASKAKPDSPRSNEGVTAPTQSAIREVDPKPEAPIPPDCGDDEAYFDITDEDDAAVGLRKIDVFAVVMKHKADITMCVNRQRVLDPTRARGVLEAEWTVTNSGQVENVVIHPECHRETAVGNCMVDVIKTWRFPSYVGLPSRHIFFPFQLERF